MSFILAKILGIYFLAIGTAFLINADRFKSIYRQVSQDPNFLFMGGVLALLIGAVIVTLHNQWVLAWPLLITVLGWWSLVKGFALLAYPNFIQYFSFLENRSNLFYRFLSLFYALLGLFLLSKGHIG